MKRKIKLRISMIKLVEGKKRKKKLTEKRNRKSNKQSREDQSSSNADCINVRFEMV